MLFANAVFGVFTGVFGVASCVWPVLDYGRRDAAVVLMCCSCIRLFVANYVCVMRTSILLVVFRVTFS